MDKLHSQLAEDVELQFSPSRRRRVDQSAQHVTPLLGFACEPPAPEDSPQSTKNRAANLVEDEPSSPSREVKRWEIELDKNLEASKVEFLDLAYLANRIEILVRSASYQATQSRPQSPSESLSRLLFIHSNLLIRLFNDPDRRKVFLSPSGSTTATMPDDDPTSSESPSRNASSSFTSFRDPFSPLICHWIPFLEYLDVQINQPLILVSRASDPHAIFNATEGTVVDASGFPIDIYRSISNDIASILTVIRFLLDLVPLICAEARCANEGNKLVECLLKHQVDAFQRIMRHDALDCMTSQVAVVSPESATRLGASFPVDMEGLYCRRRSPMLALGLLDVRTPGQPLRDIEARHDWTHRRFRTMWVPLWVSIERDVASPFPPAQLLLSALKTLSAFFKLETTYPHFARPFVHHALLAGLGDRIISVQERCFEWCASRSTVPNGQGSPLSDSGNSKAHDDMVLSAKESMTTLSGHKNEMSPHTPTKKEKQETMEFTGQALEAKNLARLSAESLMNLIKEVVKYLEKIEPVRL